MKKLRSFFILYFLLVFSIRAFAEPVWMDVKIEVPPFLIGTWMEPDKDYEPFEWVFGEDLSFTEKVTYQVGRHGTNVPFPTVCHYKQKGMLTSLQALKIQADYSHSFSYRVTEANLIESKSNSKFCSQFIENQKAQIKRPGGLRYFYKVGADSETQITEISQDRIFIKKQ